MPSIYSISLNVGLEPFSPLANDPANNCLFEVSPDLS